MSYSGKLKDSLYWWLGAKRPFIINSEYEIKLLHINREKESVKILITNLKNNTSEVVETGVGEDE